MGTTDTTNVDLVIRAKDLAAQPLEKLQETLDRLGGVLDTIEKEGGPATRTFRELASTAADFAKITNELTARRSLAEQFVASGQAATEAAKRVDAARQALREYEATLEGVKRKSADQRSTLQALNRELAEQEKQLRSANAGEASARRQAEQRGLAIEELVQQYDRLRAAELAADAASVRAEATARNRDKAVRAAAEAGAEAAKVEAAAAEKRAAADAAVAARQQDQLAAEARQKSAFLERVRAEQEAAEAGARAAEKLAKWEQTLFNLRKAAAQQAAKRNAIAADAERAAGELGKLDTSRADPEPVRRLGQELRDIIEPTAKVVGNLGQVERALRDLEALHGRAASGAKLNKDETRKLAEGYTFLGQALKSAQSQAGLVDSFREAQAEAARLEGALQEVRRRLMEYAASSRAAGSDDATLQQGIREATAEAMRLTRQLDSTRSTLAQYGRQLDAAGVDSRDLANEQQRLLSTAERLKRAYDQASDGQTKLGQAVQKANAAQKNGFELQRTALSLYQRIRGQVLSLTAAYVGLFGVISETRAVLDAATTTQRLNTQLGVAFGNDPKVVAQELEFVRAAAARLGVDLQTVAQTYGKFAISATAAGLSVSQTRDVFESFAATSRVFGLSTDDTDGLFKALGQSLGKGKVQAEELRGQIADRLPGAVNIFAKSLDIPVEKLDALFEKGGIKAASAVQLFADEYRKAIEGQILPASVRFDSEVGRLRTNLFDFRNLVADSGFLAAMTELAKRVSDFLKSTEGKQLAVDFGTALSAVANSITVGLLPALAGMVDGMRFVLTSVTDVLDPVQRFFAVLSGGQTSAEDAAEGVRKVGQALAFLGAGLALAKLLGPLVAMFAELRISMVGISAAAAAAGTGVGGFGAGLAAAGGAVLRFLGPAGLLASLAIGFLGIVGAAREAGSEIDKTLRKREEMERRAVADTKAVGGKPGEDEAITKARQTLQEVKEAERRTKAELAQAERTLRYSETRAAVRADELARMRKEVEIKQRSVSQASQAATIADSTLARELQARNPGGARNRSLLNSVDASLRAAPAGLSEERKAELRKDALGGGGDKAKAAAAKKVKDDAAAEAKRIAREQAALVNTTRGQVDALALRASKNEAVDLDAALAVVDQQYAELFENIAKIAEFNKGEASVLKQRADAEKERLKGAIRADAEVKAAGERVKALEAERDAELELQRIRAADDPAAQAQLIRDQANTTADYAAKLREAMAVEIKLAEAQGKTLEAAKARAALTILNASDPERGRKLAELQALQTELQRLTSERDALLAENEAIGPQGRDGLTGEQARVGIVTAYQAKLQEIAATAADLAQSLGRVDEAARLRAFGQSLDENLVKTRDLSASLQKDFANGFVNAIASADGSFADFAKSFIRNILLMIAQAKVLAAIQNSQGAQSIFGTIASAVVGSNHGGGMAGTGPRRTVNPMLFANAARFHGGGVPGLKPGEVPSILKSNEEVLTRDDPRHVLNGGGAGAGGVTIVNTIDPGEVASIGLGTPVGRRAMINAISMDRAVIKKVLA